jgi:hypothetical protein
MDENAVPPSPPAPLHAFLAAAGTDGRGRLWGRLRPGLTQKWV